MLKRLPIFVFLGILSVTIGCNKDDNNDSDQAGTGGSAVLNISPIHHTKYIDSCMVYIKYNAQDMPQTYDDSTWATLVDGKPVATFSGLKKGNYYLFGKGWDPDIIQEVKGGIPYVIKEETTIAVNLPVTEDHHH